LFWRGARRNKINFGDGNLFLVSYIVTTATTWAAPVGVADIYMDLPPDVPPHLVIPLPTGYSVDAGRVHWHFERWTPTEELAMYYTSSVPIGGGEWGAPGLQNAAQARAWLKFVSKSHYDATSIMAVSAITQDAGARAVLGQCIKNMEQRK
jgi:hypothetical protein